LLNDEIFQHFSTLVENVQRDFLELNEDAAPVVRNPFSPNTSIESLPDEFQVEFVELVLQLVL